MSTKETRIFVKKKENSFVMIDNNLFSDNRISYKAKGILGYLLSKPDNWTPRITDLYNHTREGFSSIRSGIEELVLAGYMELRTKVSEDGESFVGRRYYVYEEPLFVEGWRLLKNKNKNFRIDEEIISENPLGIRKKIK